MTKTKPGWMFLKLEITIELWQRFDRALKLHGMTRSKGPIVRQMLEDFCIMAEEKAQSRSSASRSKEPISRPSK